MAKRALRLLLRGTTSGRRPDRPVWDRYSSWRVGDCRQTDRHARRRPERQEQDLHQRERSLKQRHASCLHWCSSAHSVPTCHFKYSVRLPKSWFCWQQNHCGSSTASTPCSSARRAHLQEAAGHLSHQLCVAAEAQALQVHGRAEHAAVEAAPQVGVTHEHVLQCRQGGHDLPQSAKGFVPHINVSAYVPGRAKAFSGGGLCSTCVVLKLLVSPCDCD